jgi:hypothetical protein
MKFSAWQTSHKAPDITEAHHWRQSKLIRNHSVSLCWLVAHDKSLVAANETACENELRLKAELRDISSALDDPRVDNTITAVDAIKNLRAALKVIYTWCCYPDDFDFGKTKAACLFALRGSRQ